jgi:murein L,D-transpeptidase YcbB/YkuD
MKKAIFYLLSVPVLFFSCGQDRPKGKKVQRDVTITPSNAFTGLFLDSAQVAGFIGEVQLDDSVSHLLRNFYNSRNFQLAWFTEDGVAEQTQAFYTLHQKYINEFNDSSLTFPDHLDRTMERLLVKDTVILETSIPLAQMELQLTRHFFNYVSFAYTGKVDPEILQWHIPRKKIDALALLDSLVQNNGRNLEEWEPINRQYKLLKEAMLHLYEIEKKEGWEQLNFDKGKYEEGDSASVLRQVKRRLSLTGDFDSEDTTYQFTPALTNAVKRYQYRMGIKQDGIIGKDVVRELNVPLKKRIEQLLINMERMRWMPNVPDGNGVVVNIPQYRLHVFEEGEIVLQMNIVVGKTGSQTVIFSDEIKYVVFSPYWNVPSSIVRSEIFPAMQQNDNYLAQKNMEQIGFSNGLPIIRQKPGNTNSLGLVKFLFPNSYNIYLHDTPSRSLFGVEKRAFSHGCIRVEKPKELAEYLLRDSREWTPEKISRAMRGQKEKWVTLEKPLPVFISYFTAWADQEGRLNYRGDIYGHDQKMADRLFQENP